jgi:DNA-binding NtrC family response regulator
MNMEASLTTADPSYEQRVFLGLTAIVASDTMRKLFDQVHRVAQSNATVLILGESGTGKELVARAIHHYSRRASRAWVDLSCAALPEHLLESELFGHEKGAYSGADVAKPGLFEMAHQGTIFLDEIGELDTRMQAKLLRVLDGVPYYRLGGTKKVSNDVRIVTATNQDLEEATANRLFRSDLYHRLTQVTLHVPPLRDRVDDIGPLARYFLAQHDPTMALTHSAVAMLQQHNWPGNIRELRNTIFQAAVTCEGHVLGEAELRIRPSVCSSASPQPIDAARQATASLHRMSVAASSSAHAAQPTVEEMERHMVLNALASTGGHQQRAANQLGISRRTLSRKLKLYRAETTLVAS